MISKTLGLCVCLNGNPSPLMFYLPSNDVASIIISYSQGKLPLSGFIGGTTIDGVAWGVAVREIASLFSVDPNRNNNGPLGNLDPIRASGV